MPRRNIGTGDAMPTADKDEHGNVGVSLRDYLMDTINERDRKYEQRFTSIDAALTEGRQATKLALETAMLNTKEALATATANTKDALATATANTKDALTSANASIIAMGQAIETKVTERMDAAKEAVLKAEKSTEARFESVNEFRKQMGDMQGFLANKAETEIRFQAEAQSRHELEKKLDAAVAMLQNSKGRDTGIGVAWGVIAVVLGLLVAAAGLAIALTNKGAH